MEKSRCEGNGMIRHFYRIILLILMITQWGISKDKMTKVSICPQYLPQAQFAGFYVAKEKGFYENYNLDVDIRTYKSNGIVTEGLKSGELDFGTFFLSNAIKLRSQGLTLVNIGQISKQSALLLLSKKKLVLKNQRIYKVKK